MRVNIRAAVFVFLLALCTHVWSQEPVRVATYNIKFLSTDVADVTQQGDRLQKLWDVIALLDAEVIGLQEIDDRAALELIFPPAEWHIIIGDDSGNDQDLALVIRRPLEPVPPDLRDADDEHFLFEGAANNSHFPNRRDLLAVQVRIPGDGATFHVFVTHAKSRFGGRATNDHRRAGAARDIVNVIRSDFDGERIVLVGDFNDNSDDQSLNILENGNLGATGGEQNNPVTFMSCSE